VHGRAHQTGESFFIPRYVGSVFFHDPFYRNRRPSGGHWDGRFYCVYSTAPFRSGRPPSWGRCVSLSVFWRVGLLSVSRALSCFWVWLDCFYACDQERFSTHCPPSLISMFPFNPKSLPPTSGPAFFPVWHGGARIHFSSLAGGPAPSRVALEPLLAGQFHL